MANPNVRRTAQIAANMDAIVRSKELVEHELLIVRGDARVAYRHCRCAAKHAHNLNAGLPGATEGCANAEAAMTAREAVLATERLHRIDCTLAYMMRKELRLIDELRNANAALEAGAPIEAVA